MSIYEYSNGVQYTHFRHHEMSIAIYSIRVVLLLPLLTIQTINDKHIAVTAL